MDTNVDTQPMNTQETHSDLEHTDTQDAITDNENTPHNTNTQQHTNTQQPPQQKIEGLANFRRIPGTTIFRSARPDKITKQGLEEFLKLGIKRIIDLRSCNTASKEYSTATGEKLIDSVYKVYIAHESRNTPYTPELTKINTDGKAIGDKLSKPDAESLGRAHYIVDLNKYYVKHLTSSMTLSFKAWLGVLFVVDKVRHSNYAFDSVAKKHMNPAGLIGLYKTTVDVCGREICMVLRLLSEPENTPALINCTLGKDRTGMISALLMSVTGADKHAIATDYAASQDNIPAGDIQVAFLNLSLDHSFSEAKYETMIELLDYIDNTYGSTAEYLEKIGFDSDCQRRLAANIKL